MSATTLPAATAMTDASVTEAQFKTAITSQREFLAELQTKGADTASAATTNIGAVAGNYIHITGTTTITAFDNPTTAPNVTKILKFDGILTLTHNATSLILPGGANITTAAGDVAAFVHEGSGNWRCIAYLKVNGTLLYGNAIIPNTGFLSTSGDSTGTGFQFDNTTPALKVYVQGTLIASFNTSGFILDNFTTPTLLNSWVNAGGTAHTIGYYKSVTGRVHFAGGIKSGSNGTVAFTLPTGYRPSAMLYIPVVENGSFGYISIASNGNVTIYTNGIGTYLDGITFRAEA